MKLMYVINVIMSIILFIYSQIGDSDPDSYCVAIKNLDNGQTFLLHEVLSNENTTNPENPLI